ncbi:MAG TPA: cytidylate kinase family protein [Candidatus Paceibacterota bacterium]|nr:cytidylate kinase family protein [Candidatus Paceibacterota bacterium]
MKKHIITLGGMPGSGKSSTGKKLSELLGYERVSSGDFFRAMAATHGITIEEINKRAEMDRSIDDETDAWVRAQGEKENLIIDSRLAFHWIPDAFKVFLKLDPKIAAERTFAHIRDEGRVSQRAESADDAYRQMLARVESEKKRYQDLYGVDYTDESHYDLVVDTGPNDLETVTNMIADSYQNWLNQ